MESINIIIADKNIQNMVYLINKINFKENFKSYVATTNEEILEIISYTKIDGIFCNKNFTIISNIIDIPIFYIIEDNKNNNKIEICLSEINKNVLVKKDIRREITNQLLLLGYNFKLKGTQFLFEAILYIYQKKEISLVENLERNVYRYIAMRNNKTVTNIKTNIIKSTNYVYTYQDKKVLYEYFSLDIKITPKLVISTILNKLSL